MGIRLRYSFVLMISPFARFYWPILIMIYFNNSVSKLGSCNGSRKTSRERTEVGGKGGIKLEFSFFFISFSIFFSM